MPIEVDGGGSGEGSHVVRLANLYVPAVSVELCIYSDGIANPPIRMMNALGRPGGLGVRVSRHRDHADRRIVITRIAAS